MTGHVGKENLRVRQKIKGSAPGWIFAVVCFATRSEMRVPGTQVGDAEVTAHIKIILICINCLRNCCILLRNVIDEKKKNIYVYKYYNLCACHW